MVRISEIQQFPEFLETFPGNFCTICRCLKIFESLVEWKAPYMCHIVQNGAQTLKSHGITIDTRGTGPQNPGE